MRLMGIQAIYPKPNLSKASLQHKIYPYLLGDVEIKYQDQVWSTDITYIRMKHGFVYLVAIMDWYSRYVLAHEIWIQTFVLVLLKKLWQYQNRKSLIAIRVYSSPAGNLQIVLNKTTLPSAWMDAAEPMTIFS